MNLQELERAKAMKDRLNKVKSLDSVWQKWDPSNNAFTQRNDTQLNRAQSKCRRSPKKTTKRSQ